MTGITAVIGIIGFLTLVCWLVLRLARKTFNDAQIIYRLSKHRSKRNKIVT
jgi:flagellar biogenesis protein FliO